MPDELNSGSREPAVFAFANAGSLDGVIDNPAGSAAMGLWGVLAKGLMLDAEDRLYVAADLQPDLGGCIRIYGNASALSGVTSSPGDRIIGGFRSPYGGADGVDTYLFPGMDWMKY